MRRRAWHRAAAAQLDSQSIYPRGHRRTCHCGPRQTYRRIGFPHGIRLPNGIHGHAKLRPPFGPHECRHCKNWSNNAALPMSEPPKSTERAPERESWSVRSSQPTPITTEDLPDSAAAGYSADRAPLNFTLQVKAALRDLFERARAGLSMREDNFFLLLSVIIGLFAGLAVVCFRISIDYTRLWL